MKSSCTKIWFSSTLAAIVFVCLSTFAQTGQHLLPTHHVPHAVLNREAKLVAAVPGTQLMHVDIMLPLRNQDKLAELLRQLYDPSSPNYRQFLSVAQFTDQFGPTAQDYQAVVDWAHAKGFTVGDQPANLLLVPITGTVAQINTAFNVSMQVYQHPTENRTFYSPDREPTVDLKVPLWHIAGLDNYATPHPAFLKNDTTLAGTSNASTGSGPSSSFLGSDMRAAYYGGTTLTGSGQSLGLLEFAGTDLSDLNTYFSNVGQTNNVPIVLYSTDGTSTSCLYSDGCDDTEQTLDMTQAIGMAPGLSRLVMYVGSTGAAILNSMADGYNGTLDYQLSSSWTWVPSDPTENDNLFKEFQAQGQSFFQASGDQEAWTTALLDDGYVYPADDPYVTSVGGTDLETSSAGGPWSSETTWTSTGGGISPSPDDFLIQSWQVTAAEGCTNCSQTYRNGPDVSANANNSFYVCADQTDCTANYLGGTSFATPMWAAYIALANQQSVANGNGTLGSINPLIYPVGEGSSYDDDFHDVTSGCNNDYCAMTGYDLVTGWGSPNGTELINVLAPPPGNFTPVSTSFSLNVEARRTDPNQSGSASNYGGGFASVQATSATLYVTVSGTINTTNGNGTIELYYSTDGGAHWLVYNEWSETFGPTVVAIPIAGIANLDSVFVQLQAQANWTEPPLLYPGCSATASGIHATIN